MTKVSPFWPLLLRCPHPHLMTKVSPSWPLLLRCPHPHLMTKVSPCWPGQLYHTPISPTHMTLGSLNISQNHTVSQKQIADFFCPNFRLQWLGNRLSESLEICCASCPDYGPLLIKISSDSDKWFPSYCRWKFELISQGIVNKVNKNCQYF